MLDEQSLLELISYKRTVIFGAMSDGASKWWGLDGEVVEEVSLSLHLRASKHLPAAEVKDFTLSTTGPLNLREEIRRRVLNSFHPDFAAIRSNETSAASAAEESPTTTRYKEWVVPGDGKCFWHCLSAEMTFAVWKEHARSETGYALDLAVLQHEEKEASRLCKDVRADICKSSGKPEVLQRFLELQDDFQVELTDLVYIANIIGFKIRVALDESIHHYFPDFPLDITAGTDGPEIALRFRYTWGPEGSLLLGHWNLLIADSDGEVLLCQTSPIPEYMRLPELAEVGLPATNTNVELTEMELNLIECGLGLVVDSNVESESDLDLQEEDVDSSECDADPMSELLLPGQQLISHFFKPRARAAEETRSEPNFNHELDDNIIKLLKIQPSWIQKILCGGKTWELRNCSCSYRGRVYLGYKHIVHGSVEIEDSFIVGHWKDGKLTQIDVPDNCWILSTEAQSKHLVHDLDLTSRWPVVWAWVLKNPQEFKTKYKYPHKKGCQVFQTVTTKELITPPHLLAMTHQSEAVTQHQITQCRIKQHQIKQHQIKQHQIKQRQIRQHQPHRCG
jgi:hypothetical protein